MDSRSVAFIEVMAAIAVVAVAAFLILLVARHPRGRRAGGGEREAALSAPRWYELVLAIILLAVVGAFLIWQFVPGVEPGAGEADWRGGLRASVFLWVMAAAGAVALLGFLIFLIAQAPREPRTAVGARAAEAAEPSPGAEIPSGTPLLGLLVLALAFLLLNWIYVPAPRQYALMSDFVYPASFAVALVLLFDKATRSWSVKGRAETVREWLLCDALVFLLILGFLNLAGLESADTYASLFWDFLNIALFFFVFWLLDRRVTRYRFLVAYGYLIALPILLLIWRTMQAVAAPEGLSWWSTIWPFFFLAVIFFILEVIALIAASSAERPVVPAVKDAVFLVIYGVLLIVAIPEAA